LLTAHAAGRPAVAVRLFSTVAVVLALTAVAIAFPASPARAAQNTFVDDDTSIFERDIEAIAAAGITTGCGDDAFCPDQDVTRSQLAALLRRALGLPASGQDRFVDDDGSVFEADIQALAAAGITTGCNPPDNDEFCPDRAVTRGQLAALLTRALDLAPDDGDRFVDDDGSVFEADIQALAATGITAGCGDDTFCPADRVTRGQMAAFLRRALDLPLLEDPTPNAVAVSRTLRFGDEGAAVVALQERLLELGYWLPGVDGVFRSDTQHAVVALQKAASLDRDGVVDADTRRALERGVRPDPRSYTGSFLEVDRASQLLLLVEDGELRWVIDVATGRAGYTTPAGVFRIERHIDAYRYAPLGTLYRPKYFYRGIAFHGYPSVPPYPASHGCVRVTNAAMDWLWANDEAPIGQRVWVY
jgi:peptidoglycan hydrolase-like protein with peptidoglycan-binding domain